MKAHKWFSFLTILVIASMVLAACAPIVQTVEVVKTQVVEKVVEKVVTEVVEKQSTAQVIERTVEVQVEKLITPTPAPSTRTGAWLDSVTFVEQGSAEAAAAQLAAGDIDIYAYTVSNANVLKTIKENPGLQYINAFGTKDAILCNPVGPTFNNGDLNPFGSPKIREALNYLIDRDYVVQELMNGMAMAKYLPLDGASGDYARYVDLAKKLEMKYAYNLDKGKELIGLEMQALGATLGTDGKWQFNGKPVTVKFIIRTEDERKAIGLYVADQLEKAGLTVDRMLKNRSEAAPIWNQSDPAEGQWTLYTAGWINNRIDRDAGSNFDGYYTKRGGNSTYWQNVNPSPEFDALALRLSTSNFSTLDERRELFSQALDLAMQDSNAVFLVDVLSFTPSRVGVGATYDLASSIEGTPLWPYTLRWDGKEGGTIKVAQPGNLVEPWNPIGGSNQIYDAFPQRGTSDWGTVLDPYTGLTWPKRIEKAEVLAQEGLPIGKTLDWIDLKFTKEIKVPADAWADWDAKAQKFITVGEKFPSGATSKVKTTVYYPADLFTTMKWHDGSPVSVSDFVMAMIMAFDQGKPDSPIFDEASVPALDAFMTHFKGVKIVSTQPLVIETYDDSYYLDAEWIVKYLATGADGASWWPNFTFGEGPWHTIAVGALAEQNKELAFTAAKADTLKVDQINMVAGPSLEILKKYLDQAETESYIPFAPTMSQFITADEAKARWANLQSWYARRGHFWVNSGPFSLDRAFYTEKVVTLVRNPDYPEPANRWAGFGKPKIAEVALDGPGAIKIGEEAKYSAEVTFAGAPYLTQDVSAAKYLLFNEKGELITMGDATALQDGQYEIVLSKDVTGKLEAGSVKLLLAISSKLVALPTFQTLQVVVSP